MIRPVIRSDGCEFASLTEAARVCMISMAALIAATKATESNVFRKAAGFQWAYADQKPIIWPIQSSYQGKSASVVRSDGRQFSSLKAAAEVVCCMAPEIGQAARATSRGEYVEAGGYQWAYASFVPEVWPEKPDEIGETQ